jgi:hypothetical protein
LPYEVISAAEHQAARLYAKNKRAIHRANKKARSLSDRFEQFWVGLAKTCGFHLATSQKSDGPYLFAEFVDDDLRNADLLVVEAQVVDVSVDAVSSPQAQLE